ncbi:MAG: ABC transporter ATP-binding protein [Muribaculum sp.]|nr:ABC transporter ATP-binding protein [Muribaculum sp.]
MPSLIPDSISLQTNDLSIGYRHRHDSAVITTDISECLMAGELTCLLGPNGAGKSTLLKTLSGFLPPISGTVQICGKSLSQLKGKLMSQLLSVVLTERLSVENMSVEQVVALGRSPYTGFFGRLSSKDMEITEEAMLLTGIMDMKDRNAVTLSDGERQKMMIAKALAQSTPVIFLDEPTAFLDYPGKVEIMQLLGRLCHEQGKTVFLSTHDLEIALQIADRLWLMSRKEGLTTGTTAMLSADGSISRYFSSPNLSFDSSARRFIIHS